MKAKTAYKQTEIGEIPEEWEVVKLAEIAEFKNGINFTKEQKGSRGILTIDVLNMYGQSIYVDLSQLYRVDIDLKKEYFLVPGDILFVRSSLKREGVGWASLFGKWNEPVTFAGFIIRARLQRSDILPEFLIYFLRSGIARRELISSGGQVAITNISQDQLGLLNMPLPKLGEQQKIAEILSTVDDAIQKSDEIIQKTQLLKKGLLHQLLTRGIGHSRFKQTEIGEIPEEWEVINLQDVIIDAKSGFASGKRDENGIIQFRMNNISSDGRIVLDSLLKVPIPQNIEDYLLQKNDVLFNNTNSVDLIGKSAIFRGELDRVTYSNHITRIRVDKNKIIPEWVLYQLMKRWQKGYFRLICVRHVGQAGIRNNDLASLTMSIPSIIEQEKIAEILSTVDKKIEAETERKERLQKIKVGLMNDLLTGKRRVKVEA